MNKQQAKEFITNNTEALKHLSRIIRKIDTVRGCESEIDMKARQMAIEIVEEWLTEVWGYSDEYSLPHFEDEEDLYTTLNAGRD